MTPLFKSSNQNGLKAISQIPEKTRSYLWITDESPERILSLGVNRVFFFGDIKNDLYSEPSLIWSKLQVVPNDDLPEIQNYEQDYLLLSPESRYQYLNWLRDTTRKTSFSFVALYLSGLIRHLMLRNDNNVIDEIRAIIKCHNLNNHEEFIREILIPLLNISIIRDDIDIPSEIPIILDSIDNFDYLSLIYRSQKKKSLTPDLVLRYASRSGFTNKRYINLYPELFKKELQNEIDILENESGSPFFATFKFEYYENYNNDYPLKKNIEVPDTIKDKKFHDFIFNLLESAHNRVRARIYPNAKPYKFINKILAEDDEHIRLDKIISQLIAEHKKSSDTGEDLSESVSNKVFYGWMKQLKAIEVLSSIDPAKSNELALEMFRSGYKAPAIYELIAINYNKLKEYEKTIDLLIQMKCEYGYNIGFRDNFLKEALKSLEKSRQPDDDNVPKTSDNILRLNNIIKHLVSKRNKSSYAGIALPEDVSIVALSKLEDKILKIRELGNTDPLKSNKQAFKLFEAGYRTPSIYNCIAVNYRKQEDYEAELELLLQMKCDFGYEDFDSRIRQDLRILEKSEQKYKEQLSLLIS